MSKQIQIRRGTATENNNFTGAIGEITMDTTNNTLRVHDGTTAGGTTLAKQSEIPTVPTTAETVHQTMPSSRYTNIEIKQTGSFYTVSDDGWVYIRKATQSANQFIDMAVFSGNTLLYSMVNCTPSGGIPCACMLPVSKGMRFSVSYNATGATEQFYFIYANGNNAQ